MSSSERPASGADATWIALALLAALAVLVFRLGWQGYWWDEDVTLMFTRYGWRDLMVEHWGFDTHRPVYYGLQKAWIELFGENPWAVRALPVVISLPIVPLFYLIARHLPATAAPRITLLLLATFPIFVHFGRDMRMYGLMHLFLALSLWIMARMIDRPDRRGKLWIAFVLAMAAAFYAHPLAILTAALYGLWALYSVARGQLPVRFLGEALAALALFLILITPALRPFFGHLRGTLGGGQWLYPDLTLIQVYYQTAAAYPYPMLFKIPVAALLLWGLYTLPRGRPLGTLLIAQVVGLPLLVLLVSFYSPIFLTRTFAWGSMVGLLVMAHGIATIRAPLLRWGLVVVVTAGQLFWLVGYYPKEPEHQYAAFEEDFAAFDPDTDVLLLGNQWREPALRWLAPQLFEGEAWAFTHDDFRHGVVDRAYKSTFVPRADASKISLGPGRLFVFYDRQDPSPEAAVLPALTILTEGRELVSSTESPLFRLDIYARR